MSDKQTYTETLTDIRLQLSEIRSELKACNKGICQINGKVADHEKRIRKNEQGRWIVGGAASMFGAAASFLALQWDKITGS